VCVSVRYARPTERKMCQNLCKICPLSIFSRSYHRFVHFSAILCCYFHLYFGFICISLIYISKIISTVIILLGKMFSSHDYIFRPILPFLLIKAQFRVILIYKIQHFYQTLTFDFADFRLLDTAKYNSEGGLYISTQFR